MSTHDTDQVLSAAVYAAVAMAYDNERSIEDAADEILDAIEADRKRRSEPVAWQFYDDGRWWNGDDRIKDHRKNTESAGYKTRDLYTAPQPAEPVDADLVQRWQREHGVVLTPGSREAAMVVIRHDEDGKPTVWCDPEIADLVRALNDGGLATVASCSGHGWRPGNIMLADGRVLVVCKDADEAREVASHFPGINGEAPQPTLDAADLAFIADELRLAGKNRAADLVLTAMAYPTQPAVPSSKVSDDFFTNDNPKLRALNEPEKQSLPTLHFLPISELRELAMRDCSKYSDDDLAIAWELFDRLVEGGRITDAPEPVKLECPKCGADRSKVLCAGELMNCHFKGEAQSAEPVKVPSDDDSLTIAYMSGYHDGKRSMTPEGWKLVPVEPTDEQWGDLARDIIKAWDFDMKRPRELFKFLEMSGTPIPQWMREEQEMKNLDHMPSKGTRAVLIYKAMLEAAPKFGDEE